MIVVFFSYLFKLPHYGYLIIKDYIKWLLEKGWLIFEGWGLHIYVGKFGAGKTTSMVERAYRLCKRYPSLSVVTNLSLQNFPAHTNILPLKSPQDILNAPNNTLVLIDEIGTIFNSRDFAKGKESIPKILFQHLCQCRKRRMMILATTQRWNFLDKQLRDITATVNVSKSHLQHPFTRVTTVYTYDAFQYDQAFTNPMLPLPIEAAYVYVQTDFIRKLFDTAELIDNMLTAEYIPDDEILTNRGELLQIVGAELDKKSTRRYKKTVKAYG